MMKSVELIIDKAGSTKHLVDPASEAVGNVIGPKVETWRNSHVETWSSLSHDAREWLVLYGHVSRTADERTRCFKDDLELTNHWWADMLPVGGEVLGPCVSHAAAIIAERDWLTAHNLPEPTK